MKIPHTELYMQYYEKRFPLGFPHLGDPCEQSLRCINLPHVDLVKKFIEGNWRKEFESHPYYIMHSNWGRKRDRIINRAKKFRSVYSDIKKNGLKTPVIVTKKNKETHFYDGWEILDGHHRVSICINLGIDIKCQVR